MTDKVRTRFAPSPTGFMHIGSIRTALFAWLLARQNNGQFILRLEDTDQKREVEGSAEHIIKCLDILGLNRDEGPEIGGPFGPYCQSERLEIYKKWADKLIDSGRAYADPYSPEEVQAFREQARENKQAFLYRDHRPSPKLRTTSRPDDWYGKTPLRFKSDPKAYSWHDEVMGDLSTGPEVIDDFVLIKSDGFPTYNFAHIVDDTEMQITHVIRGQEFISSQPNYLNLYEALGFDMSSHTKSNEAIAELQGEEHDSESISESLWRGKPLLIPFFATVPHILAEQGSKKLSKRDGAKDVLDYISEGYLPEALINFIATLGWNDGTTQEVFSVQELIEKFSLGHVQKSGARFDDKRLLWLNGQHIRGLESTDLYHRCQDFWPSTAKNADESYKKQVLKVIQERLHTLDDLPALSGYFFATPKPDLSMIENNKQLRKLTKAELKDLFDKTINKLSDADFKVDKLQRSLNELLAQTSQKPAVLFGLIRVGLTWAPFSPGLPETLELLGKDESLKRLQTLRDLCL